MLICPNRAVIVEELDPSPPAPLSRAYGMRAATESLNAQLEFDFHNRRLPRLGLYNETGHRADDRTRQSARARHTWQRAFDRQT